MSEGPDRRWSQFGLWAMVIAAGLSPILIWALVNNPGEVPLVGQMAIAWLVSPTGIAMLFIGALGIAQSLTDRYPAKTIVACEHCGSPYELTQDGRVDADGLEPGQIFARSAVRHKVDHDPPAPGMLRRILNGIGLAIAITMVSGMALGFIWAGGWPRWALIQAVAIQVLLAAFLWLLRIYQNKKDRQTNLD